MRNKKGSFHLLLLVLILALAAFPSSSVSANHAWESYHWARTANPVPLKVIDSVTSDWDGKLNTAIADWDQSTMLSLTKEAGSDSQSTRKRCRAVAGKVHACNANYGFNGWLGLAQIWITGGVHIAQATTKVNDSYLSSGYTDTNKQHVICQEIGHDWGLDHQSESGADFNTCMDYSNALDNPHPNAGDYDQLLCIYDPTRFGQTLTSGNHTCTGTGHLDSSNSWTSSAPMPAGFGNADVHAIENWGEKVQDNGKSAVFVRDFGDGNQIVTFVTWANQ
jgi:hypothetical protein